VVRVLLDHPAIGFDCAGHILGACIRFTDVKMGIRRQCVLRVKPQKLFETYPRGAE
jgi:hypothetical protein